MCLLVHPPWLMAAMRRWWPPASQSELDPPPRCLGSLTCSANQKYSCLMTSMAQPAHKYATSGSPHATSGATHWLVWSVTQPCRMTSGYLTSSMFSVGASLLHRLLIQNWVSFIIISQFQLELLIEAFWINKTISVLYSKVVSGFLWLKSTVSHKQQHFFWRFISYCWF